MFALAVATLLVASPVKIGVPGFSAVDVPQKVVDAWAAHFVTLLGQGGTLKLTTAADIAQVLGLERQKELLGCSEGKGSCLAELAGALGVDALLTASIVKSGTSLTATIRVVSAKDGAAIASATQRVKSEDALQDWLEAQAPELRLAIARAFSVEPVEAPAPATRGPFWVPLAVGGVAAAVGASLLVAANVNAERLRSGRFMTDAELTAVASAGKTQELVGVILCAVGGAAVAGGLVWFFVGGARPASASLVPLPGGALVSFGGAL